MYFTFKICDILYCTHTHTNYIINIKLTLKIVKKKRKEKESGIINRKQTEKRKKYIKMFLNTNRKKI